MTLLEFLRLNGGASGSATPEALILLVVVRPASLERLGILHEREGLGRLPKRIVVPQVRTVGHPRREGRVRIDSARLHPGFHLHVSNSIALLLLDVVGTEVVFEFVECQLT